MERIDWFNGMEPDNSDFSFLNTTSLEALRQRFKTYWTLPGVMTGLEVSPGPSPNSVSINSGLGYDRNAEECVVPTVQIISFPNQADVDYYVRLTFIYEQASPQKHPTTGIGPDPLNPTVPYFTRLLNSFRVEVSTSTPSTDDPDILLAHIRGSGVNTFVPTENIDLGVVTRALLPQTSLQTLDHTLMSSIGVLTHAQIDSFINQLYTDTGLVQGQPLVGASMLDRINNITSGTLDNIYMNKTTATYQGFTIASVPSTNSLTFTGGKVFYRGSIFDVDTASTTLGPVTPGDPRLIVGTTSTGPNQVVLSLEPLSTGVTETQVVFGLYNGGRDLHLWLPARASKNVVSATNSAHSTNYDHASVNANTSPTTNTQLYLNNSSTTAPVSVGNGVNSQLYLGSQADPSALTSENSGEHTVFGARLAGDSTVWIAKKDKTAVKNINLVSETTTLNSTNLVGTSIYPPTGIDFTGTPGAYASKTALTIREQFNQNLLLQYLFKYSEDGTFVWDGATEEITGGPTLIVYNYFTGATLTISVSDPFPVPNNFQMLYVNWNMRQTTTKALQSQVVNTPSFFPTPSLGENPLQDEYRIVIGIRIPPTGGGDPRLLTKFDTFA